MLKGRPEVLKIDTKESGLIIGDSHGWIYCFPLKMLMEGSNYPYDFYQAHDESIKAIDLISGKED